MEVGTELVFSVDLCRLFPEHVFVFGDNLLRRGKAGQAVIRDEPNAFGIPTKRYPAMRDGAFFSDQEDEVDAVVQSLRDLWVFAKGRKVLFPVKGLGTGMAKMKSKSPVAYWGMCRILSTYFEYNNGELNESTDCTD